MLSQQCKNHSLCGRPRSISINGFISPGESVQLLVVSWEVGVNGDDERRGVFGRKGLRSRVLVLAAECWGCLLASHIRARNIPAAGP